MLSGSDPINPNELRVKRAEVIALAEGIIATARKENRDLAGPELTHFDALTAAIASLDADIASKEKVGAKSGRVNPGGLGSAITSEGRALPIFAKGQSVGEHLRRSDPTGAVSLGELVRAMAVGGGRPEVRAALAEGTDSAGGFTVPLSLFGNFFDKLRARSQVFAAGAQTLLLDTGKANTIATILTDPTAAWRAENDTISPSDMTFGAVSFTPKSLASLVVASNELIEDSLNLEDALTLSLTSALSSELDRVALIGAGSGNEPKGVSKVSGIGSVSMGTNGLALASYDPFIQALGVLQGANALDPTAVILAPRTAQEVALLKDTTGQPLRRPEAIQNLPFLTTSKLPLTETQGSASTASRAVMGYFPDLYVGVRTSLNIRVLRERYAENLQYGFLATLRADIGVAHAASFCNIVGIL